MFVKLTPVGAEHEHEEQNTCPDYFSEDALILEKDVDQTLKEKIKFIEWLKGRP
jgi:hypothetical protein